MSKRFEVNKAEIFLSNKVKFDDVVSVRIPSVREAATDPNYVTYTYLFSASTRELFSQIREVDALEKRYPTVWEMMFDNEGNGDMLLASLVGSAFSATALLMESLEYWTGLDKHGFSKLLNGKIIHQESGWIVDKDKFLQFSEVIKVIICYVKNDDFIAPKNMSEARFNVWIKTLQGRMRMAMKNGGVTLADKILILQASYDSYISLDEIQKMTIFQFNKLYQAIQEKEGYLRSWDIFTSPRFDSKANNIKHWTEKVRV